MFRSCNCVLFAALCTVAHGFFVSRIDTAGARTIGSTWTTTASRLISEPRRVPSALSMTLPTDLTGMPRLEKFLGDLELLGPLRFILVNDGAVLESVASFDNIRYDTLPRGRYATVSDGEGEFEMHLNVDKVAGATMLTKPSKDGTYELYMTRFTDAEDKALLTLVLHGKAGVYEDGAVSYWNKLKTVFGDTQKFT